MLEGKELWTGCLALDEAQGVLHLGKQTVLVAEIEEAQLCRGAVRFGTVSYTHLDVYKRQAQYILGVGVFGHYHRTGSAFVQPVNRVEIGWDAAAVVIGQ